MNTSGLNFGQRLEHWRIESGMTRPAACRALKAHAHKTTPGTLKRWEGSVKYMGKGDVLASLSFIYIHPDTGWVGNLNWLCNGEGPAYSANLSDPEQGIIKDLRTLPWRSQKGVGSMLGAFGKDYTNSRRH